MKTHTKAAVIALAAIGIAGSTAATASAETTTTRISETNRAGCWARTTHVWNEERGLVNMTVTSNCTDALVSVSQPLFDPPCQDLDGGFATFKGAGKWYDGSLPEPYVC